MRKAGLKNRSRRKGSAAKEDIPSSNSSDSNIGSSTNERRKPSNEEQALTAKNYRLAKELSDLRVRHRDETKNVTRLTLENMNLASRCREAISHVAMLKKELAMHQRRAAEALALQRQQTQRMASNVSDPGPHVAIANEIGSNQQSTEVAVEMDRMDRILASHAVPPPSPPKNATDPSSSVPGLSSQRDASPRHVVSEEWIPAASENEEKFFANFATPASGSTIEGGESRSSGRNVSQPALSGTQQCGSRPLECTSQDRPQFLPEKTPRTSPASRNYSTDEVPADEMMSDKSESRLAPTSIFPHSASPKVTVKNNYNEEFPADLDLPSSRKVFQAPLAGVDGVNDLVEQEEEADVDQTGASSIDAFEASFATTFPPSFATTLRGESAPPPASSEIYNPFFHSPNKQPPAIKSDKSASPNGDRNGGSRDSLWGEDIHHRSVTSGMDSASHRSPGALPRKHNSDGDDSSNQPLSGFDDDQLLSRNGIVGEVAEKPKMSGGVELQPSNIVNQPSSASRSLFPESPMSTFEMFENSESLETKQLDHERVNGEQFTTPPHLPAEETPERTPGEQPRRPEKAGAAAARARYEKALQPRIFGGSSRAVGRLKDRKGDSSEQAASEINPVKSIVDTTHSPSLVLKRLQQRRVKDRTAGASGAPTVRNSSPQLGSLPGGNKTNSNERPRRPGVVRSSLASTDRDMFSPSDEEDIPPRKKRDAIFSKNGAPSSANSGKNPNQIATVPVEGNSSAKDNSYPVRSRLPTGSSSKSLSPDSMNAEIRALDAMASGSYLSVESSESDVQPVLPASSSSLSGPVSKSRRNIQQPVSYAEPPLNSKLRRGDIYFPKGENSGTSVNDTPPVVSPTASSPDEVNGPRTLPRSKNRPSMGSDEVLKDLGGAPAVRL